jgi:membrane protein implicated in regulation of membrane protease activity
MNYKIFKTLFAIIVNTLIHYYILKPFFEYYNISINSLFEIGWWIELVLLIIVTILSYMTVETFFKRYFKI